MRIRAWRLALTGGAVIVLAAAGIGLALAGSPAPESSGPAQDAVHPRDAGTPAAGADTDADLLEDRLGSRGRWALRAGRHLVHGELLVTGREGELVEVWLDHGTVASIDGGSLAIAGADGETRTVALEEATKVFVGRAAGDLGDVTVGAEVFVQSRLVDGSPVARRILVVPEGLPRE